MYVQDLPTTYCTVRSAFCVAGKFNFENFWDLNLSVKIWDLDSYNKKLDFPNPNPNHDSQFVYSLVRLAEVGEGE